MHRQTQCPREVGGRTEQPTLVLTACALLLTALSAQADEDKPAATPYRPSVSTPAQLSAPGWLEVEGGVWRQLGNEARRDSVPWTAKLAFSDDWASASAVRRGFVKPTSSDKRSAATV